MSASLKPGHVWRKLMVATRVGTYSIYVHIYSDGEVFLHPQSSPCGIVCDIDRLKSELQRVSESGGELLYSIDDPDSTFQQTIGELSELILSYDVAAELIDPHPEVYGYRESYLPYLNDAVEVAALDIQGLEHYLDHARAALRGVPEFSELYKERSELCQILSERLARARDAYKKLSQLQFELASEQDLFETVQ